MFKPPPDPGSGGGGVCRWVYGVWRAQRKKPFSLFDEVISVKHFRRRTSTLIEVEVAAINVCVHCVFDFSFGVQDAADGGAAGDQEHNQDLIAHRVCRIDAGENLARHHARQSHEARRRHRNDDRHQRRTHRRPCQKHRPF